MTDWSKLKVADLKAELKKRGLAQTGLKAELVARLAEVENHEGSESEATIQGDAAKLEQSAVTSPDTVSPTQPTSDPITEDLPDAPRQTSADAQLVTSDQNAVQEAIPQISHVAEAQTEQTAQNANTTESSQRAEEKDNHRSALPSVEPQEAAEDSQKRKRRSQSPPPTAADTARKRFRPDDDGQAAQDEVVTSIKDKAWVEKHNAVDSEEVKAPAKEVAPSGEGVEPGPTIIDVAKDEVVVDKVQRDTSGERGLGEVTKLESDVESRPYTKGTADTFEQEDSPSRTRDSRFKNLFSSDAPSSSAMAISRSDDAGYDTLEVEPERVTSPAIHPATSALYIRDFMRPLHPPQLRAHLATLATPPGTDPDPDVIVSFYLDPIRTHAFVSFTNTSAASRVRSALHGRIWPDERTRKPLWVDFAPLEKVDEWIAVEEENNSKGRASAKKWEVYYDTDEDRHVTATLQEVNSGPRPQAIRKPSAIVPPPQAPAVTRGIQGAPSGPRGSGPMIHPQRSATNFTTLDQLFKSTTTKPVLYWQPVPKELAHKRLDHIDDAMSKDATTGRRVGGEINRYTFEDGDVLVDRGPEIFSGIRPPPGHRGSRGGPRGGGFGGRGGFGSRPERTYDSYRGERRDSDRRGSRDDRRY